MADSLDPKKESTQPPALNPTSQEEKTHLSQSTRKSIDQAKRFFENTSQSQDDNSYSFIKALKSYKPVIPSQKDPAYATQALSPQTFMLLNPGRKLGFPQVLKVCMAAAWLVLSASFMLGIDLGALISALEEMVSQGTLMAGIFWITTIVTNGIGIGYGSHILKANPFKPLEKTKFNRNWIWRGFAMMIMANLALGFLVNLLMELFYFLGFYPAPTPDFSITHLSFGAAFVEFMTISIIGPIMEEMFYRGLVYRSLSSFNKGFAILFSSLLFGMAHGNLGQAIPTFGVGIVLAYTYARSDSILVPICLHILNNTCLMLISTFSGLDIILSLGLWVALIVGIVVAIQERHELAAMFHQATQDKVMWKMVSRMPSFWLYVVAFLILSFIS